MRAPSFILLLKFFVCEQEFFSPIGFVSSFLRLRYMTAQCLRVAGDGEQPAERSWFLFVCK